jgi:molecular chaperone GrpE
MSTEPQTPQPEAPAEAPAAPETLENPLGGDPVAALQEELAQTKEQLLRALADQHNALRRAEKQAQDARAYAIDRFANDLLPVADNLRRAIEAVPADARSQEAVNTLLVGVEMTERLMLETFGKNGLKPVGAKGEAFDPNVHQAVAQIPSEAPAGAVAEVMQQGFVLNGRTVRPALVALSLGQASAAPPSAPASGGEPGDQVDVKV